MNKIDTMLIAPHPDDAVISLGCALQGKAFGALALLVVFSLTNAAGDRLGSVHSVTARRKREELSAVSGLADPVIFLDYPDASLRGLKDRKAVLASIVSELSRLSPHRLIVPAGIGGHPDHRLIAEMCELRRYSEHFYMFEDLPYAVQQPWVPTERVNSLIIGGHFEDKVPLIKKYASQSSVIDIQNLRLHHDAFGGERLFQWRPEQTA